VKHPWGKGNQFCINEDAGLQGARGAGPNMGNMGTSFKDYYTRMVQQNVTVVDVKHHWGKGN